jgi:hypothetical protein
MKPQKVLVVLSCLHTAIFHTPAPARGDKLYCWKCGAYRDAVEAPSFYTVRCLACSYGKDCGNALITAETAAAKHAVSKLGHRVVLADGGGTVREYIHQPVPLSLDCPPF